MISNHNFRSIFCLFFWVSFVHSTGVKVVKNTNEATLSSLNFSKVSRYLAERYNASVNTSPFIGPSQLSPLLHECFVYDSPKYYYRICPFQNVTQHEKSQYSLNFVTSTFHTVLGFWQGRLGANDDYVIDSVIFRHGSDCEDNNNKVKRKVKLNFECFTSPKQVKQTTIVSDVVETKKCVYNINLKTVYACSLGTVYSHLDPHGKTSWNGLKTMLQKGLITEEEYNGSLESLLLEYGIEKSTTKEFQEQKVVDEEKFEELVKENAELKNRILEMEKRLKFHGIKE